MKSLIEKKLKSLLYFIELNFKMRFGNKSAVDIYYDNLSQDCYDFFKDKDFEFDIYEKNYHQLIGMYGIKSIKRNKN